jgi:4-hydroxy-tetrahydrodipicolinate reductase
VGELRVIMAGATGRTGREVARALHQDPDLRLVAGVARQHAGQDLGEALGEDAWDVPLLASVAEALQRARADVLVDFTLADAAGRHALLAVAHGVRPVVGTTGIPPAEVAEVAAACERAGLGGAVIANFSFGAMLLQRFAVEALRFFDAVEVIERHHAAKKDAPSGTAARLAAVLAQAGARAPVPVHSVRLPGHVAHHEVVFGGTGEILTLRHDTISRASFGPGVCLAVRAVMDRRGVAFDLADLIAPA